MPIVGIDATQDGRNAVKNGELAMTSFQNAQVQGEGSVKAAVNLLSGKALNEGSSFDLDPSCAFAMYIPFETVTIDNVADYD